MKTFAFGRTEVRVYGGYNSVGGNCIVVKSPSLNVMLDQGVNFTQLRRFYGFFIQPDSVEELRAMGVLPPKEAYNYVDETYITHLHLDHLGSLNIPGDILTYLPSKEVAEILSKSWWFGWKQHLLSKTQSFYEFKEIVESRNVRYATVSHSAYPSYALRVDADDATILYTGDFRLRSLHKVSGNTLDTLGQLAEEGVDVLIVEGTNFGRRMNYLPPEHFEKAVTEILDKYSGNPLFLSVHPLDLEATLSLLRLLSKHDYTIVFENPYYAKLLDTMINMTQHILHSEVFFAPRTSKILHFDNIELAFLEELKDRKLAIFIPSQGVKDIEAILRILGKDSGDLIHITVVGEPLSEEWVFEEEKLESWLRLLGITSYRIHVSGHYHPYEFKEIVETIKPKELIPIHTKTPHTMVRLFNRYK